MATAPISARLRMYNVGFGDCFLLTFEYASKRKKHILIDFGSMSAAQGKRVLSPTGIANNIALETQGQLDAVIATHRHRDHVSGFTTNAKKTAPGDIIAGLNPKVVVQPWTEAPDAPRNATAPKLSAKEKSLTSGLAFAHAVAASLSREAAMRPGWFGARQGKQIRVIGEDNIKNPKAVKNLARMGPNEYLHAGARATKLSAAVPGVKFTVLGPATPDDYPDIANQRADDAKEYWMLQARASAAKAHRGLLGFPIAKGGAPPRMRWIIRQMNGARGQQVLGIVRALDKAMNNTSLILLMQVGSTRLLFPGDAQGESWAYVLNAAKNAEKNRKELSQVTFYKVGHHGSRNATPKTLWNGFAQKGKALVTAMSTKAGVHGETAPTRVPRGSLVDALESESTLCSTEKSQEPWVDIPIKFKGTKK